jgi:DNA-binding MarR family transcriptional regulator
MEKIYVGRTTEATNKFGELETRIGFTADDIKKLTDNLNEKGWVNVTLRKSKEGKPYLQVFVPSESKVEEKLPF